MRRTTHAEAGPGADSIMGVTLFREESPAGFGAFDRGLSRSE